MRKSTVDRVMKRNSPPDVASAESLKSLPEETFISRRKSPENSNKGRRELQDPVITTGGVTYKNEPWHRECFCCTHCNVSLAGQRFTSKDEKPYCANCYGELFAKRCNACTKPITGIGGAKFISFEDRHWHNDCFICAQCTTSLVGKVGLLGAHTHTPIDNRS
ncbi:LIM domain protein [Ancylostoma duodenale]|uniref:LIM domain protein n=1 Tax=Ancylostoma duodenale TaxID=51022 RepID=A0A0C2FA98_9BILA|nr:LIM domain protein [Ancylostoma duodenale]